MNQKNESTGSETGSHLGPHDGCQIEHPHTHPQVRPAAPTEARGLAEGLRAILDRADKGQRGVTKRELRALLAQAAAPETEGQR